MGTRSWRAATTAATAATALAVTAGLAACAQPQRHSWAEPKPVAATAFAEQAPSATPSASASPSVSASASATPSRRAAPKAATTLKKTVSAGADIGGKMGPPPANDGTPKHGAGTFTPAAGSTGIVGSGTTLVKYRVEVEDGIPWGAATPWTPASFAATVDQIIGAPQGWTRSAQSPVTDAAEQMTGASWSFERVSGDDFSVRIRLATPDTVDKLCGSMGMDTQGMYSCRYGQTEMINLRRWLHGAPGFPITLGEYHTMVVDHEMGHFLGFDHMKCPGSGQLAPVMQEQTIDLAGCKPNPLPFAADGSFVIGPWAAS